MLNSRGRYALDPSREHVEESGTRSGIEYINSVDSRWTITLGFADPRSPNACEPRRSRAVMSTGEEAYMIHGPDSRII